MICGPIMPLKPPFSPVWAGCFLWVSPPAVNISCPIVSFVQICWPCSESALSEVYSAHRLTVKRLDAKIELTLQLLYDDLPSWFPHQHDCSLRTAGVPQPRQPAICASCTNKISLGALRSYHRVFRCRSFRVLEPSSESAFERWSTMYRTFCLGFSVRCFSSSPSPCFDPSPLPLQTSTSAFTIQ